MKTVCPSRCLGRNFNHLVIVTGACLDFLCCWFLDATRSRGFFVFVPDVTSYALLQSYCVDMIGALVSDSEAIKYALRFGDITTIGHSQVSSNI